MKIIFQPAEEGVRGAQFDCGRGLVQNQDLFVATHLKFR